MALSASTVWEVRNGGNDDNGGGFVTGASGTDRSQQDSPHVIFDGSTITATAPAAGTVLTITGYTVTSADVGNILQITGGTNFTTGFYQITAVDTGANTWTIDRDSTTGGSGSALVGRMGGGFASPGKAVGAMVNSNITFIKYNVNPYLITTSTAAVSNGTLVHPATSSLRIIVGYDTTRTVNNNDTNRPTVKASGISSATLVGTSEGSSAARKFKNIIADGDSLSTITGFGSNENRAWLDRCTAKNCTTGFNNIGWCVNCKSENCTTGFNVSHTIACWAEGGTTGFIVGSSGSATACIADSCSADGFTLSAFGSRTAFCIAYNCGDGFDITGNSLLYACTAYGNSSIGFRCGGEGPLLRNCAAGSNTGGNTNGTFYDSPTIISLTASPFVDAANNDFNFNNDVGGGAELRAINHDLAI